MKRKILLFILTIAFCALCMGSFTSCLKHKHEHSFVLNSVTPATCRKPECRWYSCECGQTSMEYVGEALGHEWQDATCTEPQTCLVCGETRGRATGHSWTEATCTEPQTCLVCGETRGGATGHFWANATCTEPQTCLVCGETSGEALGHNMAAPTCTKPATCKRGCGHTEGEALGHTEVIDPAVESTCTESGLTEGKHCSVCEEVLVTQKVVPATGHDWKNATCTMPKTCSVCSETEGNELGHDMAVATCTVASTCKRGCGYTVGEPLGHDMAVATCTLPSTCKRNCGYTEGEALGHTEVIDPAVASTCTETGLTEGKHCSVCDSVLVAQKVVSALGHDFVNEVCSRCEKQLEYDDYLTFTYSGDRCSVRVKNINYVPEKVVIPDYVTSIEASGFKNCINMLSIEIPDSVTSIGESAFYGCSSLTEITLPFVGATKDGTSNTHFGYIFGASSYRYNENYVPISLKKVTITSGSSIGSSAFYNCSSLTSIEIPDSVTFITFSAFDGCSGLEYYTEGNLKYLGNYNNPYIYLADTASDNLTNANINQNCKFIASSAFSGCSGLTSIEIPDSVISIGMGAFNGCSSLQSISIPFVGDRVGKTSSDTYQYPFGYIFGTLSYTGGTATKQYYYGSSTSSSTNTTYYIPASLKEVTVTGGNILYGAFYNCSGLTSVIIGDSVTSIGSDAFYHCTSLTEIKIPNSVTSIGSYAFKYCSSLTSVVIGDGVTSIGYQAFYDCRKLTSVVIGDSVRSIGERAFSGCSSLTEVNYLGSIDDWAEIEFGSSSANPLYYAEQLKINSEVVTQVNLTSATKVSNYAFYYCSRLTSVVIGDSVTSIGSGAFEGCYLTSVVIGDSVTSIGENAFQNCSSETEVNYLGTIDEWAEMEFGNGYANPLYYAKQLKINGEVVTEVNLTSATKISAFSFYGCSALTSVVIGDSVTSIGSSAFEGCSSLTSLNYLGTIDQWAEIEFGSSTANPLSYTKQLKINAEIVTEVNLMSATKISDYAFYNCSNLTSVVIGDSVTSIGKRAFDGCSKLTSVVISESVTSIGYSAFSGCSSLQSMVIPFVGDKAGKTSSDTYEYQFGYIFGTSSYSGGTATKQYYYGSSTYSTYYIPTSLKEVTVTGGNILYGAFYNCSGLTSIVTGDSVTSIGSSAFRDCSGLTSVVIGDSITSIGSDAFYGCSSLTEVNYLGSIDDWAEIEFGSNMANPLCYAKQLKINGEVVTEVNLTSATKVSNYAFYNYDNLTSVIIGDSVTSIGGSAFAGCSGLTLVEIPDSVTYIRGAAFQGCSGLTSVVIGDSVTSIGNEAFKNCGKLNIIVIGNSVTTIGYEVFYGCNKSLKVINNSNKIMEEKDFRISASKDYALYVFNCYDNANLIIDDNGYIVYIANENTVNECKLLLSYIGTESELLIPSYITQINQYAFHNCCSLTSIEIPDSVTSIGNSAFEYCDDLTSVVIANSVTTIGYDAFYGCSSLTEITLPFVGATKDGTSNTHFGYIFGASSYSYNESRVPTSLKKVIITGGSSIGDYAFDGCSSLTSIEIPNSVTSIGSYAFIDCISLTSVNYLGTIDQWAEIKFGYVYANPLYYAKQLKINGEVVTEVNLTSATKVSNYAFLGCSSLTSIEIPNSVTSIGDYAFYKCSNLTLIEIPNSVSSIGDYVFYGCSSLTSIEIPNSVTSIGDYAFYGCSSLTSIVIPNSVTSIGEDAFYDCYIEYAEIPCVAYSYIENNKLKTLVLNSSEIPSSMFENGSFTSLVLSDSVTSIGSYAFEDCSSLIEVNYLGTIDQWAEMEFGNGYANPLYYAKQLKINGEVVTEVNLTSATKVSNYAFLGCSNLTSVIIPDSVTSIGGSAFEDCSSLTSVVIGDSVTSIGSYAFLGCSSLTSVVIGDSVTSIGSLAFSGCSSLIEVNYLGTIDQWAEIKFVDGTANPLYYAKQLKINGEVVTEVNLTSATKVSNYAFLGCSNLTSAVIPNSVTSIGYQAFYNCESLTSIEIPNSVTSIGSYVFYGCSSLTSIEIPDSVTSIGYNAFYGCSSLTSIEIPDSVTSIGSSAFNGCSSLQSMIIPFIGDRVGKTSSDTYQYPFGYIFGTSSYTGGTATKQYYCGSSTGNITSSTYYIPTSLKEVIVTGGNILYGAFYNCSGLTSVIIPNSVTSIGTYAFYNCSSLTSVVIGDSVTSIGYSAFYGCSLTKVYYKGSSTEWDNITVDGYNTPLKNATRYYYSESQPTESGNYWHYDENGNVVVW